MWITEVRTSAGVLFVRLEPHADGDDRLSLLDGVLLVGRESTQPSLRSRTGATTVHEPDESAVIDVRPAQRWSRGAGAIDPASAIDLWNLAEDVLRSTTGDSLTSGPTADALHAHLTAAAVSWLWPGAPRSWTPAELRRLRIILVRAERVVLSSFREGEQRSTFPAQPAEQSGCK